MTAITSWAHIAQKQPIPVSALTPLKIDAGAIRKLTDAEITDFKKLLAPPSVPEHAGNTPSLMADNHPSKLYAEIWKDGSIVGKVYKGGSAETSNLLGARLNSFFQSVDDRDLRAEAIAKASGGTIRYV